MGNGVVGAIRFEPQTQTSLPIFRLRTPSERDGRSPAKEESSSPGVIGATNSIEHVVSVGNGARQNKKRGLGFRRLDSD